MVELRRTIWEATDSFAAKKKSLEECRTSLSLYAAKLSTDLAFPDDLAVLARRCIGVVIAVLEVAHREEGSCFKVHKGGGLRRFTGILLSLLEPVVSIFLLRKMRFCNSLLINVFFEFGCSFEHLSFSFYALNFVEFGVVIASILLFVAYLVIYLKLHLLLVVAISFITCDLFLES